MCATKCSEQTQDSGEVALEEEVAEVAFDCRNVSGRERWIDVARGLAMLCVIVGHMGHGKLVKIWIFSFHMPLFFLLAGYFQSVCATRTFAMKRAKQLLVPYAFTCIALIAFTQLNNLAKIVLHMNDAQAAGYLLNEWIKAGLLGSGARTDFLWIHSDIPVGAIWFLLALFFAQILVNLLIDQKHGFLWILGITVLGIVSAHFFWLPLSIQAGAAASIFVAAGYLYRNKSGGVFHN